MWAVAKNFDYEALGSFCLESVDIYVLLKSSKGRKRMKSRYFKLSFWGILLSTHVALAAINNQSEYWECSAYDVDYREWTIQSPYQRMAINLALDGCKKESQAPSSCKVAKEQCELFVNGKSTRALWRCMALDDKAKKWFSNTYAKRDDAAIAALDYCKANSSSSDSCYINLLTCRDLNHT
jgi:hypothetical protein